MDKGITSDKLTSHQNEAFLKITAWLFQSVEEMKSGQALSKPVFTFFGCAGSGKTHTTGVLEQILQKKGIKAVYGCYTGKAASVMREKGMPEATTIHDLIYKPFIDEVTGDVTFELDAESRVAEADLVILDEVSMVDNDTGADLASFGKPMLVIGDMVRQLPPISGQSYFYTESPDAELTEIRRTKDGSPIPFAAMAAFENPNTDLKQFKTADFNALGHRKLDDRILLAANQILCGTNKTRISLNKRFNALKGIGCYPEVGSRIMVLRNDHDRNLMNGEQATIQSITKMDVKANIRYLSKMLKSSNKNPNAIKKALGYLERGDSNVRFWMAEIKKDGSNVVQSIPISLKHFELEDTGAKQLDEGENRCDYFLSMCLKPIEATWAQAASVHKSQGSEWGKVVMYDDGFGTWGNQEENLRSRWLYTGITRSSDKLLFLSNRY